MEKSVRVFDSGNYFGERAIIERVPRTASVVAQGPVKCLALDAPGFERLLGPLKDVFRGKSDLYISESSGNENILTSSHLIQQTDIKKCLEPTGWFMVADIVFKTNVKSLLGRQFENEKLFYKYMTKGLENEKRKNTDNNFSFMVAGNQYPTRIPFLVGKQFETLEQYSKFFRSH